MFNSIKSKFHLLALALALLLISGYSLFAFIFESKMAPVDQTEGLLLLEHDIAALNLSFMRAHVQEEKVMGEDWNAEEFSLLYGQICDEIDRQLARLQKNDVPQGLRAQLTAIQQEFTARRDAFSTFFQLRKDEKMQMTELQAKYHDLLEAAFISTDPAILQNVISFAYAFSRYSGVSGLEHYFFLLQCSQNLGKDAFASDGTVQRGKSDVFVVALENNRTLREELLSLEKKLEECSFGIQKRLLLVTEESQLLIGDTQRKNLLLREELWLIALLFILVWGGIFFLLLWWISRRFMRPFDGLLNAIERIDEENDTARFVSNVSQKEQVVRLGLAFNAMLDRLAGKKRAVEKLQQEQEKNLQLLSEGNAEREALQNKIRRIEKMEAVGRLAGGVAHDLNNILSGVVSYPDLLLWELPEESPYRKPVLTIQESGKRAAAIVQDLLTLARRGVSTTSITNLNDLVEEYVLSPEYRKLCSFHSGISVKLDLERKLLNVTGSPVHLEKVIMNLVSNASEAIEKKGEVSIRTANIFLEHPLPSYVDVRPGEYVLLEVSDTGIGIAPEHLDKIFEPFFTKKEMGRSGTGLGLAVVWGSVEDHRGYIDVQSEMGKGTIFSIYLPATREALDCVSDCRPERYRGHGESILVVDDVESQREVGTRLLSALGYRVDAVSSGEEAITFVQQQPVDLLVLDMIMSPGMDGLDTYLKIQEFSPGQKAVITSGYSETCRVEMAKDAGASCYLRKPYTMESLGQAVFVALEGRDASA